MPVLCDIDGGAGVTCALLLGQLPTWFGIPAANEAYVAAADTHPSVIASIDGADVGITTVTHHSPYAAEVHLMAVAPAHHRHGIGTAMLRHLERRLADAGVEFLQVKTLSAAHPDAGYAATLAVLPRLRVPSPRGVPDAVGREQPGAAADQAVRPRRAQPVTAEDGSGRRRVTTSTHERSAGREERYRDAERRLWVAHDAMPTERTLRLARTGAAVRVQEVGAGPPVVFIHGASNAGTSWAPLVVRLPDLRCVLLDRPGCGLSPPLAAGRSDMAALDAVADALVPDVLDALDLDGAAVVGTSFGALPRAAGGRRLPGPGHGPRSARLALRRAGRGGAARDAGGVAAAAASAGDAGPTDRVDGAPPARADRPARRAGERTVRGRRDGVVPGAVA